MTGRSLVTGTALRQYLAVWTGLLIPPALYWSFAAPGEALMIIAGAALYIYSASTLCFCAFLLARNVPVASPFVPAVLAYAIFVVVAIFAHEQFAVMVYEWVAFSPDPVSRALAAGPRVLTAVILVNMLIAGNAIGLASRAHAREQATESLRSELAQARIQALTATLNPDETYAALARIRAEVVTQPDEALNRIAELGDHLRARMGMNANGATGSAGAGRDVTAETG